jgi:hypothetical protein
MCVCVCVFSPVYQEHAQIRKISPCVSAYWEKFNNEENEIQLDRISLFPVHQFPMLKNFLRYRRICEDQFFYVVSSIVFLIDIREVIDCSLPQPACLVLVE